MSGITDLGTLLEAMKPERVSGEFVFCSVSEEQLADLSLIPKLMFREDEGITLILHKESAEQSGLSFSGIWAMITLSVHSDLEAVGFLAAIFKKLAEAEISVNAVSAYYHDHLFVPYDKADEAMKLLRELSVQGRRR